MSKYTAELRTIIDNQFDIFDFEYTRTSESQAIVSNEALQQGFIDHFYFREVGFETLERFKKRLKTQWLESLGEFDKLLVAYNQDINIKSTNKLHSKTVFEDTPISKLENKNYATNITSNENDGYSGITEIELLEIYKNKLKDIQTEFYNSFDNLFMQIF